MSMILAPDAVSPDPAAQTTPFPSPRRWSTAEYHRMAEVGLLDPDERVELIDGEVLPMSPIGSPHRVAVYKTVRRLEVACGTGFYVDAQAPITLADGQEPQPDIVVAEGSVSDYSDQHPAPAQVRLVVEVSDATLARDQTKKAALYAEAGIAEYWILNLYARRLEVRRDPAVGLGYRSLTLFGEDDTVRCLAAPQSTLLVSDLLP